MHVSYPLPDRPATPRRAGSKHLRPGSSFAPFAKDELEQGVCERFEQWARRAPTRLAVKTRNHQFSYGALNHFANRVARAIQALRRPGPEPVLLLLDKDAPLIAAMLGVLKAGKFYVPLSPSYPEARNAFIAADSGAGVIVTDAHNLAAARRFARPGVQILNADTLPPNVGGSDLGLAVGPGAYAYVIYTSGSTGQPKGVVDTHRNLLQNIRRYTNSHFLSADDRLVCVNSCAFSNSLKDIYGALLNGGSLFPVDIESEGLAPLAGVLAREGITVLNAVATVFRNFAGTLSGAEDFPRLRVIRLGSEGVTRQDVELFRRHFRPGCVLVNGYGTTETGTARVNVIGHDTEVNDGALPIGYPVDETEVLLLDAAGVPVGFDRVGQIAIRSAYLSPGYWQRPDLTAAVFRPDPQGGDRRLYLTGDLGLMRPDGCLVYAGRRDQQVKIRGNRIELAEIELALLEVPRVQAAAVVSRPDLPEARSLVAYVVPRRGHGRPPTTSDLRTFLTKRLPPYAVPTGYVLMDALPLTPTGKVDRRALPAPPPGRPELAAPFVAPRSRLEARLAAVWEELLKVRPVGVKDNFFDLGGHSLLAAQLFHRIGEAFGVNLPLAVLLQEGTIEDLARHLGRPAAAARPSCLVPIQPKGPRPPFYCVHGVGGEVLSFERLARHLGGEQPFFGLQSLARGGTPPHTRIEDMAASYLAAVLQAQPAGPYYLGGFSAGAAVAYEMARQLRERGREVALLVLIDQRRPNLDPEVAWTREGLTRFVRNLPAWLGEDLLRSGPGEWASRARVRLGTARRRLAAWLGLVPPAGPSAADLFDLARVPDDYQTFLDATYRALRAYVPRPYAGRVALYRARSQPLFRWHEPLLGWKGLLTGPLDFRVIPGTHDTVLTEPNVHVLADALLGSLEWAQGGRAAAAPAQPLPGLPARFATHPTVAWS